MKRKTLEPPCPHRGESHLDPKFPYKEGL